MLAVMLKACSFGDASPRELVNTSFGHDQSKMPSHSNVKHKIDTTPKYHELCRSEKWISSCKRVCPVELKCSMVRSELGRHCLCSEADGIEA